MAPSQSAGIRELILRAEIFNPGVQDRGYGPGTFMRKVPMLIDHDKAEVSAELQRMYEEGLVVPFDDANPSVWKSTAEGRSARERLARRCHERAPCLASPEDHALADLLLALAVSSDICDGDHSYPPSERRLEDYLFDFRQDLQSSIEALEAQGLVRLKLLPGSRRAGKCLIATLDGLKEYRRNVASRLGVAADVCVLDAQAAPAALTDSLTAAGLDAALVGNLSMRIAEAERCEGAGASLAATVLYGSILEGVLQGLAARHPKTANSSSVVPRGDGGKPKPFGDWKFSEWIAVAKDVGWIPQSVGGYADQLRSYRNLVHVSK